MRSPEHWRSFGIAFARLHVEVGQPGRVSVRPNWQRFGARVYRDRDQDVGGWPSGVGPSNRNRLQLLASVARRWRSAAVPPSWGHRRGREPVLHEHGRSGLKRVAFVAASALHLLPSDDPASTLCGRVPMRKHPRFHSERCRGLSGTLCIRRSLRVAAFMPRTLRSLASWGSSPLLRG